MGTAQVLFIASCAIIIGNTVGTQNNLALTYQVSPDRIIQDTSNYVETQEQNFLKKYMLSPHVKCNDGSPAGFYLRQSNYSKTWIVFLEEGWCCYDKSSCDARWSRASYLMSSKEWTETKSVGGILSNDVEENPYWWQANHVFVPYCTSDIWSGRRSEPQPGSKFTFMGSIVIKQVIRELLTMGLANANTLILSGSSAGGVGVMLNLDPIQKMLRHYSSMSVHGISDSGWFLDHQPFKLQDEILGKVQPIEAVKLGIPYWHSQIPTRCRNRYTNEPAKCFIGYKIYPTLSVPLFVFQWLYDEFQLKNDVGTGTGTQRTTITQQQWDSIHKMGERLRKSLSNVTSVFAPSCVGHTVLTKKDWKKIQVNQVTLPSALHCWQMETRYAKMNRKKSRANNIYHKHNGGHCKDARKQQHKTDKHSTTENTLKKKHKISRCISEDGHSLRPRESDKSAHKKRRRHHNIHGSCRHQYIQNCSWPQCNSTCPKLQNPNTGEEVDLMQLLQSFGVNIPNLSSELGIDVDSLMHMDQGELLNLLTQQSN